MHRRLTAKHWRLVAATVTLVVVVVVVLAARGGGDGGDPFERLRSVEGVTAVRAPTETGGTTSVALAGDIGVAAVREVLAALPSGDAVLTVGRTRLTTSARRPDPALAKPFVALARLREPAREITLDDTAGVTVEVDRREQGAPIARAVAFALAPRGRWPAGVDGARVRLSRSPSTVDPRLVALDDRYREQRSMHGALDAAVALRDRLGRLEVAGKRIELRVRVQGVADAGRAWRSTAGRLGAAAGDVSLYLDPEPRDDELRAPGPVLSGTADERPTSALRLLRALDAVADRPFASVPPTYVQATVQRLADGGDVATVARRAGVERLQVTQADADGTWLDGTEMSEPDDLPEVRDAPDTVRRLVQGTARLARAGVTMQWSEASFGTADARFSRPSWLAEDTDLAEEPAQLRRLATAIRSAGWPGRARFVVALGPGSCGENDAQRQAAAVITSTAHGRASKVVGSGCDGSVATAAVRRAWNATAD